MKRPSLVSFVTVLALLTSAGICRANNPNPEIVPGEVVVGVRAGLDAPAKWLGTASNVGTAAGYVRQLHVYRILLRPGLTIDAAITILKKRADVLYAEPNHVVHAVADPNDPYYVNGTQWGPQKVQANLAWAIWNPVAPTIL